MKNRITFLYRPVLMCMSAVLILSSCVTPLDPGQGEYMLSVINTGDIDLIEDIVSSPILIDSYVIVSPADASQYLSQFSMSAGPLPEKVDTVLSRGDLPVEENLETDTFFSSILPEEYVMYSVEHEQGTVFIILGKGETGIQLYGFIGPVKEN